MHTQRSDDRWHRFREHLRAQVSTTNWDAWLACLEPQLEPDRLTLIAPNEFHLQWIRDKHGPVVHQAVEDVFGDQVSLDFMVVERSPVEPAPQGETATPVQKPDPSPSPSKANSPGLVFQKYRFENFVVGQSNRFAAAAAQAVAEQPGSHYNPLFIYGGAGLGKTHLLNAIAHHALELYPDLVVRYVSSEDFFSEFIDGIRRKRMDEFKNKYRRTDILLLDDVQFFEGKEQILEEFFHTFNTLYASGKQMVISSDRPPRSLSSLEDRLRSRFEMGLLTDIQPPDIETRLAILRRNADFAPREVPDDVLTFIAGLVVDNIRELEGALTRVTAYAALTSENITLEMAQRELQHLLPGHEAKAVGPEDIVRVTADAWGYTVDDLKGESRRQPLALCRQVAMYLCRELTDLSLPKIGNVFGGRDHTTVMYANQKIRSVMTTDREVFDRVSQISQSLRTSA